MSQNLDPKDKICLDPTESAGLMEHFSRLSPGDEVRGTFVATLDEAGQKMVVLSIQELSVDKPDDEEAEPVGDDEAEEGEGAPAGAAIQLIKNDDGVSSGEDNTTPEIMPAH